VVICLEPWCSAPASEPKTDPHSERRRGRKYPYTSQVSSIVGSLLPPAERPFGTYELIAKIATGGMAEILLAREKTDEGKLVVIKRVLPHLLDETRFIAMFRDEGRLAAQIIHPNVCRVFDSGAVQQTYFIAMEYLHGVPLSRMLIRAARTKNMVDIGIAVGIVMQCAAGLHHAHELCSRDGRPLDVVHRDVSPPNILVTAEGVAKMLDFGVAKARGATQKTRTGTIKGKNSYMSPEQILGKAVDKRSDVFSLGVVLWESLTAKRLFSRDTDFLTFTAITKTDVPDIQEVRPEVSDELAAVVQKALAQDREARYSTAKEFRDALGGALVGQHAMPEAIGLYIRQAFSKELAANQELTDKISSGGFEAVEQEVKTDSAPGSARSRPSTKPLKQAAIDLVIAENTPLSVESTNTDHLQAQSDHKRLIVPVILASFVSGVAVLYLTRGGNQDPKASEASVAAALDAGQPMASRNQPAPDATVSLIMSDAAPTVEMPEVEDAPKIDKRPAYLTIDSAPYATIFVDGKKLGVTPIFKAKLSPGTHKLRAVSATGAKKHMKLKLKPGRTKNLGRLRW
jgi:serine/threonine protein kinase